MLPRSVSARPALTGCWALLLFVSLLSPTLAVNSTIPAPRSYFEQTADFGKRSVPRIQEHLLYMEEYLGCQSVAGLDEDQRCRRAQCIDALADYRRRGRFPSLPPGMEPSPVFVDTVGTACAVGYLMIQTGAAELAASIAATSNFAYVEELADRPEVVTWVRDSGLSLEECAMVQPTYCFGGAPTDVEVVSVGDDVLVTWTNQDDYDYISVSIIPTGGPPFPYASENVPGDATSHLFVDVPWGSYDLWIGGACDGGWPDPWTFVPFIHEPAVYRRGDVDEDGSLGLADGVQLLNYLFVGGPELDCEAAGDADADGQHGLADALYIFVYLFLDGPEPAAPFPECSPDDTTPLSCRVSSCP